MKQSEYVTRVLEPSEGFVLTQAADVPVGERVFSEKVYLAVNDTPDNWREITQAEADTLKAEQRQTAEAELSDLRNNKTPVPESGDVI